MVAKLVIEYSSSSKSSPKRISAENLELGFSDRSSLDSNLNTDNVVQQISLEILSKKVLARRSLTKQRTLSLLLAKERSMETSSILYQEKINRQNCRNQMRRFVIIIV